MSGDALNLVLALVTLVLGAAISYYFYRIARKERRPVYYTRTNVVVRGDRERQIEVRYKGQVVPSVFRTVVALWNAGREPIRREDIVQGHPLGVEGPGKVLEAKIIATTRREIDFACPVEKGGSRVKLEFSHINFQDGGAVEILHTGGILFFEEFPGQVGVGMEGAIVGVNGPPRFRVPSESEWFPTSLALIGILLAIVAGLATYIVLADVRIDAPAWLVALAAIPFLFMGVGGLVARRRAKTGIPKVLRDALGLPPI
jgi:hypothetical protein